MERKTVLILTVFAVAAFIFRSYLLPTHLFFGPEQGKDFLVIRDIVVSHKMTLIGPKTDVSGIFHGPIYYYLATIPFALSKGNPLWVAYFMIALQALTVYVLFLVGTLLTNKNRTGYIAALLFVCSFGSIVYARWISGQPLTFPLVTLFYLGIIQFLRGKKWYLLLSAVSFGLCGQAEFMNFLLLTTTGISIVLFYHKKFFGPMLPLSLVSLVIALVVSLGNFLLFDLRHEFLIMKSIGGLLTGNAEHHISLISSFGSVITMFTAVINDLLGIPYVWMSGIVLCLFFYSLWVFRTKKEVLIIASGIIIPLLTLVILRRGVLEQLYLPILIPFLVYGSYVIDRVYEAKKKIGIVILVSFVCVNLYTIYTCLPSNTRVFFQSPQPYVRYSDQIAVIHDIYRKAEGNPFGIQTYTIPYFWQDGWTYLFWWQGTTKYGYIPNEKDDKRLYVIIQRDRNNPDFQNNWLLKTVPTWGNLTYVFEKGEYRVEERLKEN